MTTSHTRAAALSAPRPQRMMVFARIIAIVVLTHMAFVSARMTGSLYALANKASTFTVGVLMALYRRHETGKGDYLDLAMADSLLACLPNNMGTAMTDYARAYADQVDRDYERFAAACRSGELEARTDEDMAADFRM